MVAVPALPPHSGPHPGPPPGPRPGALPARAIDAAQPVLAIDLDGTLVRCDLLHESLLKLVVADPAALLRLPGWLLQGKAQFKREVAARVELDVTQLPYERQLVDWIVVQRGLGRRIVLCTASDARLANAVAAYLPLFDEVLASDGRTNLAAAHKAGALVARYGAKGFDYAGNSRADIAVWAEARAAIVVGAPPGVRAAAARAAPVEHEFGEAPGGLRTWVRALRMHQWVKNLLVFLPLLGAHRLLDATLLFQAVWAFVAFGMCASSVYLINDMIDIDSDRRHPRKRERPFASGRLPVPWGAAASAALLLGAFGIAFGAVRWQFAAWLGVYFASTLCYTFWLKRKILVDSLVLAALYTLRVLGGGAAVDIAPGFWLLAFSLFLFLSLALVKRYSELVIMLAEGRNGTVGRDYLVDDRHLVESLGIASGFSAVMVMALYINGETVARLYPHQEMIWFTVPVLLYWVSRLWLKAHRGEMHDDPVVFAMADNVSRVTIALFFATLMLASMR